MARDRDRGQSGFHQQKRAASLTGYGLIVGLIAIVAIVAISAVGQQVTGLFSAVGTQMEAVSSGIPGSGSGSGNNNDGSGENEEAITEENQAPEAGETSLNATYLIDEPFSLPLQITDPNDDELTYTVTTGSLPPGVLIDMPNGQLTGDLSSAGPFVFGITATDPGALSSPEVTVTLSAVFPERCMDILGTGLDTGNGIYEVDPPGATGLTEVYCDMTAFGGGWMLFSRTDGDNNVLATHITNGYGIPNPADPDSGSWAYLGSVFTLEAEIARVEMGDVNDFYKPIVNKTMLEMLTEYNFHEWSDDPDAAFIMPGYYGTPGTSHLLGSQNKWPQDNLAGDDRRFLSFIGNGNSTAKGGCCYTEKDFGGDIPTADSAASWGLSYRLWLR